MKFRLEISLMRFLYAVIVVWILFLIVLNDAELQRIAYLDPGEGQGVVQAGYWMGHGLIQLGFLLAVYLLGLALSRKDLRRVAAQGVAAFVASGILSQVVKHLIGRPRPRLHWLGVENFGPALSSGLDSFPSGHTTTSMAIAYVLARRYPKYAPLFMGAACFVAASRILGGSHFPLDIIGGTALGLSVGWAVTAFWPKDGPISPDVEAEE